MSLKMTQQQKEIYKNNINSEIKEKKQKSSIRRNLPTKKIEYENLDDVSKEKIPKNNLCMGCNKIKSYQEFQIIFDKVHNIFYLDDLCNKCDTSAQVILNSLGKIFKEKDENEVYVIHYAGFNREINTKLSQNLRGRINHAIKFNKKADHTINLLGCSVDDLRVYLESMFTSEMTWENYGSYWHIDHIKPCAAFDLSISEQQFECFHYTNLQPMEAHENLVKNASWED
jgi:hypothetical protein